MNKLPTIILLFSIMLALTACAGTTEVSPPISEASADVATPATTDTPTKAPTSTPTETPSPTPTPSGPPMVEEFRITTNDARQVQPAVSDKWVVWTDYRNDQPDIYAYDLSTGEETQLTAGEENDYYPLLVGSQLIWVHKGEFYGMDLGEENAEAFSICNPGAMILSCPATCGLDITGKKWKLTYGARLEYGASDRAVVWNEKVKDNIYDIIVYDLKRAEQIRITEDDPAQRLPDAAGDLIVWTDERNDEGDIYAFDLETREEFPIVTAPLTQTMPATDGVLVVWIDQRNDYEEIYGYNLASGEEFPIVTGPGSRSAPDVWGNFIIWNQKDNNDWNIYGYDLLSGKTFPIVTEDGWQGNPRIWNNVVVWTDQRRPITTDIYGAVLLYGGKEADLVLPTPMPSSPTPTPTPTDTPVPTAIPTNTPTPTNTATVRVEKTAPSTPEVTPPSAPTPTPLVVALHHRLQPGEIISDTVEFEYGDFDKITQWVENPFSNIVEYEGTSVHYDRHSGTGRLGQVEIPYQLSARADAPAGDYRIAACYDLIAVSPFQFELSSRFHCRVLVDIGVTVAEPEADSTTGAGEPVTIDQLSMPEPPDASGVSRAITLTHLLRPGEVFSNTVLLAGSSFLKGYSEEIDNPVSNVLEYKTLRLQGVYEGAFDVGQILVAYELHASSDAAAGDYQITACYDLESSVEIELFPSFGCARKIVLTVKIVDGAGSNVADEETPSAEPPVPFIAVVQSTALNLRSGPATSFPIEDTLSQGDELEVIGQYKDCAWLQVKTTQGKEGWVSGNAQYVTLNVDCEDVPTASYRPRTGVIRDKVTRAGLGELTVENGTGSDGVVVLTTLDDQTVMAAYVREKETVRMTGIPDGTYRLYYAKGKNWDPDEKEFTENVSRQRFEDTFTFEMSGFQYTTWQVTLYPVAGGTAQSEDVDPKDFPSLD